MEDSSNQRAFDIARAPAFVCDLIIGQPTDHSLRTAWLARQLAIVEGIDPPECYAVCEASLLRSSECTANASDFAGKAVPIEARILRTVVAWLELRSARPWRKALSAYEAMAQLKKDTKSGRFDPNIVEYIGSATLAERQPPQRLPNAARLSSRETEVLHRISLGASNKEVARDLAISPSTVRTHIESVFRKLECTTRAAATLKASAMGLLPSESIGAGIQRNFLSFIQPK